MTFNNCNLLGIKVSSGNFFQIEQRLLDKWEKTELIDLMTLSFPMLGVYEKNPEYQAAIDSSAIVLPDGIMLIWLSRLFRCGIEKRLAGPDFFLRFSETAQRCKMGYFFLGSTEKTLQKIDARLKNDFPGIRRKGFYAPPFGSWGDEENEKIIRTVNRSGADILWVGLTAPRQEIWLHTHKEKLQVKMAAAIGAAFDFYAGTRKRAPLWMQKAGLEWFHRVVREPYRMGKRYLGNTPAFMKWLIKSALRKKN